MVSRLDEFDAQLPIKLELSQRLRDRWGCEVPERREETDGGVVLFN